MAAKKLEKREKRVRILKALAHPIRLQMVEMLQGGELCVCVFQDAFQVDFSTVSRHLTLLKNAGIVSSEKRGKNVYYTCCFPCVLSMLECIDRV